MNILRKIVGFISIPLALCVGYLLWQQTLAGKIGINKEEQVVAQWTLLPVSLPILLGLIIFGFYAVTGEYDRAEK